MKATVSVDPKKDNFLIDGFPRNLDNQEGWTKAMSDKTNLRFVLFFDCKEEVRIFFSIIL